MSEAANHPWQHGNRGHEGGIVYRTELTSRSQNGVHPIWEKVVEEPLTMEGLDYIIATHNDLLAALRRIRAVVDEQAEDEGLWGVPLDGSQPITEAYLQQELRNLHRVIESSTASLPTEESK